MLLAEKVPITRITIARRDQCPSGKPSGMAFERLKESIHERGLLTPVFVSPGLVCLTGHYRLWACQDLGWKEIPVVVVESVQEAAGLLGMP